MSFVKRVLLGILRLINAVFGVVGCRVVLAPKVLRGKGGVKIHEIDYVRYAALYMAAEEINAGGLPGNVAELGVYRGGFAKHINRVFPERTLYLFDTFEGLDIRDVTYDKEQGYMDVDWKFIYKDAGAVMKQMPYPDKCRIVKGYFPESLTQLQNANDLSFCFVSLDVDLYKPVCEGLKFFYKRVVSGGYIFVHDYSHNVFFGVKAAVKEFLASEGIDAGYFLLPDDSGTIAIMKPHGKSNIKYGGEQL